LYYNAQDEVDNCGATMNLEQAKKLISNSSKVMEDMFKEFGRLEGQLFHFADHNDEVHVAMFPIPEGVRDKNLITAAMRSLLKEAQARWCLTIVEAWVLQASKEEADKVDWKVGIAAHPERTEAIIYQFEDQQLGALGAHQQIERQQDSALKKPVVKLKALEFEENITFSEGRYVGLLPQGKLQS
jgi:hypothetical protein